MSVSMSLIGLVPRDVMAAWMALESFCRARSACWPSNRALAERMGVGTKQAVQALLGKLESLGIAERDQREGNRRIIRLNRRVVDAMSPAEWEAMMAAAELAELEPEPAAELEPEPAAELAELAELEPEPAPILDRGPIQDGPRGPIQDGPERMTPQLEERQQAGPAVVVLDRDQEPEPAELEPIAEPEPEPAGPRRVVALARRIVARLDARLRPPGRPPEAARGHDVRSEPEPARSPLRPPETATPSRVTPATPDWLLTDPAAGSPVR